MDEETIGRAKLDVVPVSTGDSTLKIHVYAVKSHHGDGINFSAG